MERLYENRSTEGLESELDKYYSEVGIKDKERLIIELNNQLIALQRCIEEEEKMVNDRKVVRKFLLDKLEKREKEK